MPPKSPKKVVSPAARVSSPLKKKTNVTPLVSSRASTTTRANLVTSSSTLVENFDVHWVTKYQGVLSQNPPESAFVYPMKKAYNETQVIGDLNIVKSVTYRRDPSKEGNVELIGQHGTTFGWDCFVTERSNDTDDASSIGKLIAAEFTKFGKNNSAFKNAPVYVFHKDVSSDPPKPLNYFLCDIECIRLLMLQYAEENSKEDVMADDGIMTAYFGSPEEGERVLEDVAESDWRPLN